MNQPQSIDGARGARWADGLLIVSLSALAFLLGCYELFDQDVWWHLRAGQWILEHGRVPQLDLFTFSSADRAWIDLHWGFQVALALAYRSGGVAGMILMAAAAACASFTIALTARDRGWPIWVAATCWFPALALMCTRFDPRPEIFSLVFLAGFLAVLWRAERRPALAWALPPIQALWVNSHGLFILGPIVLSFYLADRAARSLGVLPRLDDGLGDGPRNPWRHLVPASLAVALACLANPYGLRGATFPLELFPKIADPGNPYKAYVDEFVSLRTAVLGQLRQMPGVHLPLRIHVYLTTLLPWSFLLPAVWRACREPGGRGDRSGTGPVSIWAIGLAIAIGGSVATAMVAPFPETPAWLIRMSPIVPMTLLVVGMFVAAALAVRSRRAAMMMAFGVAGIAAWDVWLMADLFGRAARVPAFGVVELGYLAAVLGLPAAALVLRSGGSLFRMLLAASFTYLMFQAVRNVNLFGLVVGSVLAWNLGEWVCSLSADLPIRRGHRIAAWAARGLILGLILLWAGTLVTDRYYRIEGDDMHFGLRERRLTFAHDAARFAGRPGLPGRALVFDLGQTGVYIYHNGPDRKVFMDARLEVPDRSTFQAYVRIEEWLKRDDLRWVAAIRRLGDPLILLNHDGETESEASLLAHPRWRCIYFDAIASIYVPREGPSSAPGYPEIDFADSRFRKAAESASPMDPRRAMAEAAALRRLGFVLRKRGAAPWAIRIPLLIGASDRIHEVLSGGVGGPVPWRFLGLIEWDMVPDLTRPPPRPSDAWDPATGLPWARATYCFRRALETAPRDEATLRSLAECFGVRKMTEAQRTVESLLGRRDRGTDGLRLPVRAREPITSRSWSDADRIAANDLHVGDPDSARRVWGEAADPPSPGMRLTRMAGADLAALDASAAEVRCRQALSLDKSLGEAWFVLASALLELGRADDALDACREGLKYELSTAQREAILGIQGMLMHRRR
ncbi:MAG: hypothetical protein ACLQGP_20735 [Isosphaeraceae bacterium]